MANHRPFVSALSTAVPPCGFRTTASSSTSTLYSVPSYSRIMRRHCGCGGLLVGKRLQEVWEKKRKMGTIIIIINKKLTGKINMNKKEENKHNIT